MQKVCWVTMQLPLTIPRWSKAQLQLMCRAVALERLRITDLQQLRDAHAELDEEMRTSWGLRQRLAKRPMNTNVLHLDV